MFDDLKLLFLQISNILINYNVDTDLEDKELLKYIPITEGSLIMYDNKKVYVEKVFPDLNEIGIRFESGVTKIVSMELY